MQEEIQGPEQGQLYQNFFFTAWLHNQGKHPNTNCKTRTEYRLASAIKSLWGVGKGPGPWLNRGQYRVVPYYISVCVPDRFLPVASGGVCKKSF
jgi:hypothetical protein